MSLNVGLLRRVMTHIEQHPEQHDQDTWSQQTECGTTYCFAGWTVKLGDPDAEFIYDEQARDEAYWLRGGDSIPHRAGELLGINSTQYVALFINATNRDELRALVDEYTAEASS